MRTGAQPIRWPEGRDGQAAQPIERQPWARLRFNGNNPSAPAGIASAPSSRSSFPSWIFIGVIVENSSFWGKKIKNFGGILGGGSFLVEF